MFRKNKNQNIGRQPLNRQLRSGNYTYYSASKDSLDRIAKPEASGRKSSKNNKPLFMVLALVVVAVFFYESFLGDVPKVVVQQPQSPLVSSANLDAYATFTKKQIDKNFSNRNKITINTEAIASALQKEFPSIESASLNVPLLGSTPTLHIVPAKPALVLIEADGQRYALADSGSVISSLGTSNYGGLPTLNDESGVNVIVGQQTLPEDYASFVSLIYAQFQARGVKTHKWSLMADGELDIYITGSPYFVKFNLNDSSDGQQQVGDFFAVRQYLDGQGTKPAHYIDARIPGRAYYK